MKTTARKRVLDLEKEWRFLLSLLPQGWREMAWKLNAMRRHRGSLADPEKLLRILLMHVGTDCSLKQTAVHAGELGWGRISAVGLFKRLRSAGRWLGWIARGLWKRALPEGTRRVLAVDATTVCETGKTGSQWRVHWCVNLRDLQCEFFELTDIHGGEKYARYPLQKDDLVLGDRGYSNPAGIDYVRRQGADVLVRVNPPSLPLYARKDGGRLNILGLVRRMRVHEVRAWSAWVKGPEGRWHRGRLVVTRRSRQATLRELRKQKKNAKSSDGPPGKLARALARYVLVWTSVPATEMPMRQVLRHFRYRWQLELVFKRVKSIMGLGQLPKHSDESSRGWLNGKLLTAMLVETLWRRADAFSPWG